MNTNLLIKRFIRGILKKSLNLPIPFKILKVIEKWSQYSQGKGCSLISIETEINSCIGLLNRQPRVFLDIGSNKGLYTQELLKKNSALECHLFEPSKLNIKHLKKEFSLKKKVFINQFALSDRKSKGQLYFDYEGSGTASLTKRRLDHFDIKINKEEDILLQRFDEYWKEEQGIIDYVKVDVEGHELDVLKGFGKFISLTKLIQFEFGGTCIDSRIYFQDFWYFFLENNFEIYRISPRGPVLIKTYSENDELFVYTNYIAVNKLI